MRLDNFACWWIPLDKLAPRTIGGRTFYETPALIGCALAVTRAVYDRLLGFDPQMQSWGLEDLDFGLKAWLCGIPVLHDPAAVVGHRFRATFHNYAVPPDHIAVNEFRTARKHLTDPHWVEWLEQARLRHVPGDDRPPVIDGGLTGASMLPHVRTPVARLEHPEGRWAHLWTQFLVNRVSIEQERAYFLSRRQHDEVWFARKFGLAWPVWPQASATTTRTHNRPCGCSDANYARAATVASANGPDLFGSEGGGGPSPMPSPQPSPMPSPMPSPAPCTQRIARIVVDGSNPERSGSAIVTAGRAIRLRALPQDTETGWPTGSPKWKFQQKPAGSTAKLPSAGAESVSFSPDVPGEYVVEATCCNVAAVFTLLAIRVQLKEVSFGGDGYRNIASDQGELYDAPHLRYHGCPCDAQPDRKREVLCYRRGSTPGVALKLCVTGGDGICGPLRLRGKCTKTDLGFPEITVNVNDAEVTIPETALTGQLKNEVGVVTLDFSWECRLSDDTAWASIGDFNGTAYLTLDTPGVLNLAHTILDVSCRAAQGAADKWGVLNGLWQKLQTLRINRVDGTPLKYYRCYIYDNDCVPTASEMLKAADGAGKCMAWSDFMGWCLLVHGISGVRRIGLSVNRQITGVLCKSSGFLVKGWTFQGAGTLRNNPSVPNGFWWEVNVDAIHNGKIPPGQYNPNPPAQFGDHSILRVDLGVPFIPMWFDPSYGIGPYLSTLDYEAAAIAGITCQIGDSDRYACREWSPQIAPALIFTE